MSKGSTLGSGVSNKLLMVALLVVGFHWDEEIPFFGAVGVWSNEQGSFGLKYIQLFTNSVQTGSSNWMKQTLKGWPERINFTNYDETNSTYNRNQTSTMQREHIRRQGSSLRRQETLVDSEHFTRQQE